MTERFTSMDGAYSVKWLCERAAGKVTLMSYLKDLVERAHVSAVEALHAESLPPTLWHQALPLFASRDAARTELNAFLRTVALMSGAPSDRAAWLAPRAAWHLMEQEIELSPLPAGLSTQRLSGRSDEDLLAARQTTLDTLRYREAEAREREDRLRGLYLAGRSG